MIPQITSMEQALDLAHPVMNALRGLGIEAALAGGYLRDADNGVQPKDMDIYLTTRGRAAQEIIDQIELAMPGHTFRLLGQGNNAEANPYNDGLIVYESVDKPEDHFPINFMLTPEDHPLSFDVGLCDIFWLGGDNGVMKSGRYARDKAEGKITVYRFQDAHLENRRGVQANNDMEDMNNVTRVVAHINRIKEKYPDSRVVFDYQLARRLNFPNIYNLFVEEELIGDPRTLLPAQGQELDWDPLRLQDGAAAVQQPRVGRNHQIFFQDAFVPPAGWDDAARQRAMEAIANIVPNQPQIQPGPAPEVAPAIDPGFGIGVPPPAPAPRRARARQPNRGPQANRF